MKPTRKHIRQFSSALIMVMIGGQIAPIGYVIGGTLSMIGFILLMNVKETGLVILSILLCSIGLVILLFRIRQDVIEIKDETK